jgi:hypothetical protein
MTIDLNSVIQSPRLADSIGRFGRPEGRDCRTHAVAKDGGERRSPESVTLGRQPAARQGRLLDIASSFRVSCGAQMHD